MHRVVRLSHEHLVERASPFPTWAVALRSVFLRHPAKSAHLQQVPRPALG